MCENNFPLWINSPITNLLNLKNLFLLAIKAETHSNFSKKEFYILKQYDTKPIFDKHYKSMLYLN